MSESARIKELMGTVELLKARLSNALEEAADLRDEAERSRLVDKLAAARRRNAKLAEELADQRALMDEMAAESALSADLDDWEVEE